MKSETLAALQEARTKRQAVTLATRLSDAAETLVYRDTANGPLADDAGDRLGRAPRHGGRPQRDGRYRRPEDLPATSTCRRRA